jgi:hypothetical protein
MDIRWLGFGAIEIDGERHERDVVIDAGRVERRHKGPGKPCWDDPGTRPCRRASTSRGAASAWSWAPVRTAGCRSWTRSGRAEALPPLCWWVPAGRAPSTVYTVREQDAGSLPRVVASVIESTGITRWSDLPARLEAVLDTHGA